MTLQIHELAVDPGQDQRLEMLRRRAEDAGELGPSIAVRRHDLRLTPHGVHGRADRERLAVAIGDHATVCGRLDGAEITCVTMVLQKLAVRELEIHRTPREDAREQREHGQHELAASRSGEIFRARVHDRIR